MDESEKTTKKRRRVTIWRVFFFLLLIVVVAFAVFRFRLRSKLNARIEAIRAAGYPMTSAELNAWYTIPHGVENAAETICNAFSFFHEPNETDIEILPLFGQAEFPAHTEPLTGAMQTLITQFIADNNEALDLFHAGARIEHCRYPVDFNAVNEATFSHHRGLKNGTRLLCLDALQHAENGQAELAVRSILSGFGLARSLAGEPIFGAQMLLNRLGDLTLEALERIVNKIELSDGQMAELTESINSSEHAHDILRGFVGWQCMFLGFVKDPISASTAFRDPRLPPRSVLEAYQFLGLADRDAIVHLNIMADTIEMCKLPIHERYKPALAIDAKQMSNSEKHILLWLRNEMSDITRVDATGIAHLRTARVGLAILRFRQSIGKLPDTLTDLVPAYLDAVPKDPFDGNELRYKKRRAGFVIYSIGEDLSDDGGAEQLPRDRKSKKKRRPNWDVTFIVER